MIKDQNSEECMNAFDEYLKGTKDYKNRVEFRGSLSYDDDEWYIWQNAWRACINQNASFPSQDRVKSTKVEAYVVKALSEETQETLARCVKALVSCDCDYDRAKEWLRVNRPNYVWSGQ